MSEEQETDLKESLVKTRDFLNFLTNYEDLPAFVKSDAGSLLKRFPTDYNITRLFNK